MVLLMMDAAKLYLMINVKKAYERPFVWIVVLQRQSPLMQSSENMPPITGPIGQSPLNGSNKSQYL